MQPTLNAHLTEDAYYLTSANVPAKRGVDGKLYVYCMPGSFRQPVETGARVPVAIVGPLAAVLQRVLAQTYPVQTMHLVLNETGSRMSLATMRRRFWNARKAAGITYQLRDIRAKAGSDLDSIRSAQKLLGHSNESTTTAYRRDRVGEVAQPVMRDIKSKR